MMLLTSALIFCLASAQIPLPEGEIRAEGSDFFGLVSGAPSGNDFVQVTGAGEYAVARNTQGELTAWGTDRYGLVSDTPTGSGHQYVNGSYLNCLAIDVNGAIVGWGKDRHGVVSGPPSGTDFVQVATAGQTGLALRSNGSMVGWGLDYYKLITDIPPENDFIQIGSGGNTFWALRADGSLEVWGFNLSKIVSDAPTTTGFRQVAMASDYGIAVHWSGQLITWGDTSPAPAGSHYIDVGIANRRPIALSCQGKVYEWIRHGTLTAIGTGVVGLSDSSTGLKTFGIGRSQHLLRVEHLPHAGSQIQISLGKGTVGSMAYLAGSLNPGSTHLPGFNVTLNLDNPRMLGHGKTTNSDGAVRWRFNLPPRMAGQVFYLQAYQHSFTSNLLTIPVL